MSVGVRVRVIGTAVRTPACVWCVCGRMTSSGLDRQEQRFLASGQ